MDALMNSTALTWSPYQRAIFDRIEDPRGGNFNVKAVAGSGKTTTIIEACNMMRGDVIMLAFNAAAAKEIRIRLEEKGAHRAKGSTFHSAGSGAWSRHLGGNRPPLDDTKTYKILDQMQSDGEVTFDEKMALQTTINKIVGFAKKYCIGTPYGPPIEDQDAWMELVEHFDIVIDTDGALSPPPVGEKGTDGPSDRGQDESNFADEDELVAGVHDIYDAIELAKTVLVRSNALGDRMIDYDDMLYLPLLHDVSFWRHDWVVVDEAQDCNPARVAIARKLLKPGGRFVAVGDPCQSIYGFTGAMSDAMDKLSAQFGCDEMPLTVSYRCPQAVVRRAQEIVPYIEAHEGAPEGSVDHMLEFDMGDLLPTDAILCRNTAPLVGTAYRLIRRRVGCRIEGRDIGKGLIRLVENMRADGLADLVEKLDAWEAREVARWLDKHMDMKAQAVTDRVEAVRVLARDMPVDDTVDELCRILAEMFTPARGGTLITLATAHRSKGREWDRVIIIRPDLMPCKWAKQDWEKEQEVNLEYVAVTRAKRDLVFAGKIV